MGAAGLVFGLVVIGAASWMMYHVRPWPAVFLVAGILSIVLVASLYVVDDKQWAAGLAISLGIVLPVHIALRLRAERATRR